MPGGPRFVEYYAAGCPHCVHLAPVWKQAAEQWAVAHGDSAVRWEQKQCLDGQWKDGPDHEECEQQGIESFPTMKFFPEAGAPGVGYEGARSVEALTNFVQEHYHPSATTNAAMESSCPAAAALWVPPPPVRRTDEA